MHMKRIFMLLMSFALIVSSLGAAAVYAAPTTDGLAVYYKFDENYTDSTGNGRNATANGSALSFIDGMDGKA